MDESLSAQTNGGPLQNCHSANTTKSTQKRSAKALFTLSYMVSFELKKLL